MPHRRSSAAPWCPGVRRVARAAGRGRGWALGAALAFHATVATLGLPAEAAAQDARPVERGSISGVVLGVFQGERRALGFAVVEAWGPGGRRTAVADSAGRYALADLPAGPVRLTVRHAGHDTRVLEVLVPAGADVPVDLALQARPVEMAPLDVTGRTLTVPDPERRDVGPDGRTLSDVEAAVIEGGAGLTQSGLADALRSLGGNDPGSATDVLFMRGSTTDLKLVLLDGAPVYTPFHVAGLLRSFEPEVLGRADLHVGGAPARFDGGLTSILDLRTRRPGRDRLHASGSLDLVSGMMALDGPLFAGTGFVASARSLHGLGEAPLGASPYGYRDLLVSAETELTPDHVIRSTAFWNRESVLLDLPGSVGIARLGAPDEAAWSNRAVSGVYQGQVGGLLLDVTVAGGDYHATLPLQPSAPPGEPAPAPLMASADNRRLRSGIEVARPTRRGVVRFGLSHEDLQAAYGAVAFGSGRTVLDTRGSARTTGGYVDVSRTVAPEVSVRAGIRGDHFTGPGGGFRVAPRASVSWSVAPTALLTVAAGRYHQHARTSDTRVERTLEEVVGGGLEADDAPLSGPDLLPVATADHVVVSLEQSLGEATLLGLEGFWKGFTGLRPDQDAPIRSSGIDLRIQRQSEALVGWLGYGLSWFWSSADLSGRGQDFTGRHLLTAGLRGRLAGVVGGEARLAYGAGLPYTSVPFRNDLGAPTVGEEVDRPTEVLEQASPFAGGIEDSFLRVDLELHAALTAEWGGRTWDIRPYVRILNALDRRDALFYAFQPWRGDGVTPLAERPLVPIVGVSWRF